MFFLIFIVVPAVELWLLVTVGSRIGVLPTLGLIVATGIVGAALVRHQGMGVLSKIRTDLAQQTLPTNHMVDGVLILVAGALLLTPGILTDCVGFSLLLPPVRSLLRSRLAAFLETKAHAHVVTAVPMGFPGAHNPSADRPPPGTIDVEAREEES